MTNTTKRRRRFSEREVLQTLIGQGVRIICFRCDKPIKDAKDAEREHLIELELCGLDAPENCAYSHAECHSIITNGTKATSAGSSKHRIAKAKRIVRTQKFVVTKSAAPLLCEVGGISPCVCGGVEIGGAIVDCDRLTPRPKRKIPSRQFKKKENRP